MIGKNDFTNIKSKDNKHIKLLKKLTQKKYRQLHGQFVVENATSIYDGLKAAYDFVSLFVTEKYIEKNPSEFQFFKERSVSKNIFIIDSLLNKHFSCLDTASGIAALYDIIPKKINDQLPVIYLNAINDPGNLGTIMRTMLGFGFYNLVIDENCVDVYNAKTINAAKDAIFKINIFKDKDFKWLKENKNHLAVYASNVHKGTDLEKFRPAQKYCLIMGSESHGVNPEIAKLSIENIMIEVSGDLESLNVVVATSIFLYKLKN